MTSGSRCRILSLCHASQLKHQLTVISACVCVSLNTIFFCQIEASEVSTEKVLVFFKLQPTVITEDNLHQSILVSSMLDSPINTLYQAVRQVFAPALLKVSLSSYREEPQRCNIIVFNQKYLKVFSPQGFDKRFWCPAKKEQKLITIVILKVVSLLHLFSG